jgi:hypothetical protein
MSKPIPVNHPAAFRYVPKGGRNARLGLVALTTPVELPEVDPSGFDEIGMLSRGAERGFRRGIIARERLLYARDGSVWVGLQRNDGAPVDRGDLEGFLSGPNDVVAEDDTDLARHFSRTPALAMPDGFKRRRSDVALDRMRSVEADGAIRARADLLRFIAEDVAIVEGRVRVRLRSVVGSLYHPTWNDRSEPVVVRPSIFPRTNRSQHCAWRVDRPAEYVAYLTRHRLLRNDVEVQMKLPGAEGVEAYLGLSGNGPFPFDLTLGGEVTLFVNEAHGQLQRLTVVQEMSKLPGLGDGALRALSRSRAWDMLGAMSAIRPSEYGDCLEDLRTMAAEAQAVHSRAANSGSIRRLLTTLDEAILPAWRDLTGPMGAVGLADEDEAALGGLAP